MQPHLDTGSPHTRINTAQKNGGSVTCLVEIPETPPLPLEDGSSGGREEFGAGLSHAEKMGNAGECPCDSPSSSRSSSPQRSHTHSRREHSPPSSISSHATQELLPNQSTVANATAHPTLSPFTANPCSGGVDPLQSQVSFDVTRSSQIPSVSSSSLTSPHASFSLSEQWKEKRQAAAAADRSESERDTLQRSNSTISSPTESPQPVTISSHSTPTTPPFAFASEKNRSGVATSSRFFQHSSTNPNSRHGSGAKLSLQPHSGSAVVQKMIWHRFSQSTPRLPQPCSAMLPSTSPSHVSAFDNDTGSSSTQDEERLAVEDGILSRTFSSSTPQQPTHHHLDFFANLSMGSTDGNVSPTPPLPGSPALVAEAMAGSSPTHSDSVPPSSSLSCLSLLPTAAPSEGWGCQLGVEGPHGTDSSSAAMRSVARSPTVQLCGAFEEDAANRSGSHPIYHRRSNTTDMGIRGTPIANSGTTMMTKWSASRERLLLTAPPTSRPVAGQRDLMNSSSQTARANVVSAGTVPRATATLLTSPSHRPTPHSQRTVQGSSGSGPDLPQQPPPPQQQQQQQQGRLLAPTQEPSVLEVSADGGAVSAYPCRGSLHAVPRPLSAGPPSRYSNAALLPVLSDGAVTQRGESSTVLTGRRGEPLVEFIPDEDAVSCPRPPPATTTAQPVPAVWAAEDSVTGVVACASMPEAYPLYHYPGEDVLLLPSPEPVLFSTEANGGTEIETSGALSLPAPPPMLTFLHPSDSTSARENSLPAPSAVHQAEKDSEPLEAPLSNTTTDTASVGVLHTTASRQPYREPHLHTTPRVKSPDSVLTGNLTATSPKVHNNVTVTKENAPQKNISSSYLLDSPYTTSNSSESSSVRNTLMLTKTNTAGTTPFSSLNQLTVKVASSSPKIQFGAGDNFGGVGGNVSITVTNAGALSTDQWNSPRSMSSKHNVSTPTRTTTSKLQSPPPFLSDSVAAQPPPQDPERAISLPVPRKDHHLLCVESPPPGSTASSEVHPSGDSSSVASRQSHERRHTVVSSPSSTEQSEKGTQEEPRVRSARHPLGSGSFRASMLTFGSPLLTAGDGSATFLHSGGSLPSKRAVGFVVEKDSDGPGAISGLPEHHQQPSLGGSFSTVRSSDALLLPARPGGASPSRFGSPSGANFSMSSSSNLSSARFNSQSTSPHIMNCVMADTAAAQQQPPLSNWSTTSFFEHSAMLWDSKRADPVDEPLEVPRKARTSSTRSSSRSLTSPGGKMPWSRLSVSSLAAISFASHSIPSAPTHLPPSFSEPDLEAIPLLEVVPNLGSLSFPQSQLNRVSTTTFPPAHRSTTSRKTATPHSTRDARTGGPKKPAVALPPASERWASRTSPSRHSTPLPPLHSEEVQPPLRKLSRLLPPLQLHSSRSSSSPVQPATARRPVSISMASLEGSPTITQSGVRRTPPKSFEEECGTPFQTNAPLPVAPSPPLFSFPEHYSPRGHSQIRRSTASLSITSLSEENGGVVPPPPPSDQDSHLVWSSPPSEKPLGSSTHFARDSLHFSKEGTGTPINGQRNSCTTSPLPLPSSVRHTLSSSNEAVGFCTGSTFGGPLPTVTTSSTLSAPLCASSSVVNKESTSESAGRWPSSPVEHRSATPPRRSSPAEEDPEKSQRSETTRTTTAPKATVSAVHATLEESQRAENGIVEQQQESKTASVELKDTVVCPTSGSSALKAELKPLSSTPLRYAAQPMAQQQSTAAQLSNGAGDPSVVRRGAGACPRENDSLSSSLHNSSSPQCKSATAMNASCVVCDASGTTLMLPVVPTTEGVFELSGNNSGSAHMAGLLPPNAHCSLAWQMSGSFNDVQFFNAIPYDMLDSFAGGSFGASNTTNGSLLLPSNAGGWSNLHAVTHLTTNSAADAPQLSSGGSSITLIDQKSGLPQVPSSKNLPVQPLTVGDSPDSAAGSGRPLLKQDGRLPQQENDEEEERGGAALAPVHRQHTVQGQGTSAPPLGPPHGSASASPRHSLGPCGSAERKDSEKDRNIDTSSLMPPPVTFRETMPYRLDSMSLEIPSPVKGGPPPHHF